MTRGWMPLYVADYLADTGHLSNTEHGIYMLLIMHYWQKGSLPRDDKRLASIAKAKLSDWERKFKPVISEFFDENWIHKRIEDEIEKSRVSYAKRAAAGREGGKTKASNARAMSEKNPSNALPNARARQSQSQSHISSFHSDIDKTAAKILQTAVCEKTAFELLQHRKRKKAPLTARAAEGLVKRFMQHGNAEEAAEAMMVNDWKGFEPNWMTHGIEPAGRDRPKHKDPYIAALHKLMEKQSDGRKVNLPNGVDSDITTPLGNAIAGGK